MSWWCWSLIGIGAVAFVAMPKAPGVFGYWHAWQGIGIERGLIWRLRCGFWSYDLLPGSLAAKVVKITDVWLIR